MNNQTGALQIQQSMIGRNKPPFDSVTLDILPDEVLLNILSFLHVPDLLQCSRTNHRLRALAADPILHNERRRLACWNLERSLSRRRTCTAISPPNAWIWLGRTNVLSRSISRSLVRIRLSHSLQSRPSTQDLVMRAIIPQFAVNISPVLVQSQGAIYRKRLRDYLSRRLERRPSVNSLISLNILPEECAKGTISPAIVDARRKVIKESLKDGLRGWVENRAIKAQRTRALELDETERRTVKVLVQRLTARKHATDLEAKVDAASTERRKAQARYGRALEVQRMKDERKISGQIAGCPHPTRAHVLGLRRYWENAIRTTTA